eukprot:543068-Prymnesium_polylepis.1
MANTVESRSQCSSRGKWRPQGGILAVLQRRCRDRHVPSRQNNARSFTTSPIACVKLWPMADDVARG